MNSGKAFEFLNSLINYEKKFASYNQIHYDPLKITSILNEADIPYQSIKFFHIAGTKGKGSTSTYLFNLLKNHTGSKVGLYTSPHFFRVNERISVNGNEISDEELSKILFSHKNLIERNQLTYFETLTFAAIVYFVKEKCEYVVLETGLGGRLDATNFCKPQVSIITSISYDHTKVLGNTLPKIALEKAGIIKENIPVVSATQRPSVLKVLIEEARKKNAPFYYLPSNVKYSIRRREDSFAIVDIKIGDYRIESLLIKKPSDVLVENFITALFAFYIFQNKLDDESVRESAKVNIPFRMELKNNFLFDVAHNDSSLNKLFESLRKYKIGNGKRKILVIGVLIDKEIERIARVIFANIDLFEKIFVVELEGPRASGSLKLYNILSEKTKKVVYLNSKTPLSFESEFFYIITGSFYIIPKYSDSNF